MPIHTIEFSSPAKLITSLSPSFISKKGPFIVAYLGRINKDKPQGQVYYIRPLTSYDKKNDRLTIFLTADEPSIHQNDNVVSTNILFDGKIVIQNFEFGKSSADQSIYVDLQISNNTGMPLRSLQVHNGVTGDNEFPLYGKIAYFLFSSKYWIDKKREYHRRSVSVAKLLPATNFIIELSKK